MNLVNLKTITKLKLSAHNTTQKNKNSLLPFANAGSIIVLWTHSVAAWPHLSNVHGHHSMLLPCHQQKDVFYQAMNKSQDRMRTQLPSCDSEHAQSSPAFGHALFKWPEFWLHDGPYFVPDTCQGRDWGLHRQCQQAVNHYNDRQESETHFLPQTNFGKRRGGSKPHTRRLVDWVWAVRNASAPVCTKEELTLGQGKSSQFFPSNSFLP